MMGPRSKGAGRKTATWALGQQRPSLVELEQEIRATYDLTKANAKGMRKRGGASQWAPKLCRLLGFMDAMPAQGIPPQDFMGGETEDTGITGWALAAKGWEVIVHIQDATRERHKLEKERLRRWAKREEKPHVVAWARDSGFGPLQTSPLSAMTLAPTLGANPANRACAAKAASLYNPTF